MGRVISQELRWEVFESDDFRCRQCGKRGVLELDHIQPRARGGTDERSNLQTLCRRCNREKVARPYGINLALRLNGSSRKSGPRPNRRCPALSIVEVIRFPQFDSLVGQCSSCRRYISMSTGTLRLTAHTPFPLDPEARRHAEKYTQRLQDEFKSGKAHKLTLDEIAASVGLSA